MITDNRSVMHREWLLWAKVNPTSNQVHKLIYHLLDVGQVTLALWRLALPTQTRHQFARWLNLGEEATGQLLAYWASLHDLGKAAPGFQRKHNGAIPALEKSGFAFPDPSIKPARHGAVTTWALKSLLVEEYGISRNDAIQLSHVLGGHHGVWPTPGDLGPTSLKHSDRGDKIWDNSRRELVKLMGEVFNPPRGICLPENPETQNALLVLFSGLTSTADWIGSMEEFFPYVDSQIPIEQYSSQSSRQAETALHALGWVGWQPDSKRVTFTEMFPLITSPNPMQQAVILASQNMTSPSLVIIEAPTGGGKTEAALYLADTWLQAWQGRGLYIAMPTQATSNQMYQRVTDFLAQRYPRQALNVHLIHGAALLTEKEANPQGVAEDESDPSEGSVRAAAWFLPRKRTLLAPFGVGTVDQALMSVLQTRHFFVRLFGLGHKVVVFDEIHAYDTYMSTLFQRLLGWLRVIGSSVILLSATLPEATRRDLATAWLGVKQADITQAEYPRLTVVDQKQVISFTLPAPPTRTLHLERISADPQVLAAHLSQVLKDGGCAAVICNRVKRAQDVYNALKAEEIVSPDDLILFHARFPFVWREAIEKKVLNRFGKGGQRRKAIVVATQVIEQSLDLDFDYMISDMAPVDLLIQRSGRLHRHPQNDATRPATLNQPRLALVSPPEDKELPEFGDDERIYDRSILLRSWLCLRGRDRIDLPKDTSTLIETVYSNYLLLEGKNSFLAQAIRTADDKVRREVEKEVFEARKRLVARPSDDEMITDKNSKLEEEEKPEVHMAFRALTRLAEPGVALVCLHRTPFGLALEPDGSGAPINLDESLTPERTRAFLQHAVNVQRRDVLEYFWKQSTPSVWKEKAALRYHHLAVFDEQGRCKLEGTPLTLVLSRETGLAIEKEGL